MAAPVIDLSDVEVVDNHCHPLEATPTAGLPDWRRYFTESSDERTQTEAVVDTALYRRLTGRMAAFLGCEPDETTVLSARAAIPRDDLVRRLFADARISGLVVDGGYPPSTTALGAGTLSELTGCRTASLLRVEVAFERLVAAHDHLGDLLDATAAMVADLRADGYRGIKSIAGYRTGLDVRRWDDAETQASFAEARTEVARTGSVRLGHKPLLDTLLHRCLAAAADQGLPAQFHVGYGDADVDLRTASPLHLRGVLEEHPSLSVVLLHGCWPYVREGAFLSAIYPGAYLDLSYGIPYLGLGELRAMTTAALAAAPWGKLMYSSDGARVPELHWIGAHDGRAVLGGVLGAMVADGELPAGEAHRVGADILAGTAERLYEMA